MFDTFCPDERSASLRALMQTATVLVPGEIKAIESVSAEVIHIFSSGTAS